MSYFNKSILVVLILISVACSQRTEHYTMDEYVEDIVEYEEETNGKSALVKPVAKKQNRKSNSAVVMHTINDNSGTLGNIPLPANWKVHPKGANSAGKAGITGPNGIKVYEVMGKYYSYNQDPYIRQAYEMSGTPMRAMPAAQQIEKEVIFPAAAKTNARLVAQYDLPKVANADRQFDSQLFKSVPSQRGFYAKASEWEANGTSYLYVLRINVSDGQGLQIWGYFYNVLEAPTAEFAEAKKHVLHGMTNIQYNPSWIQAYNQREAQKSQSSWAAHNQRMQQNQANFDASQKAINSSNEAINNSIMSTYRTNDAASDRSQASFNNYIRDENTVTDPYSGNQYQVESGANQYWMNEQGEYIQSNDYLYNPNTDPSMYNQNWNEVEVDY